MNLQDYLDKSNYSVSPERKGLSICAGILSAIAAFFLFFNFGAMTVPNSLFFLTSVGMAACCFAFAERKAGYIIIPLTLGVIASVLGAIIYLFHLFRYGMWHGAFMGVLSYLVIAVAFAAAILYYLEIIEDSSVTTIICAVAGALAIVLFFIAGVPWNISYLLLIIAICIIVNATQKLSAEEIARLKSKKENLNIDYGGLNSGTEEKEAYILSESIGIHPSVFGSNADINNLVERGLSEEKNVALCVIFSIITMGIYGIYWIYTICRKIKALAGDNSGVAGEVVCILFVPFYALYWSYSREEKLCQAGILRGIRFEDNKILYTIFTLFSLFIVTMIFMQNDLNRVTQLMHRGHDMSCRTDIQAADVTGFYSQSQSYGSQGSYQQPSDYMTQQNYQQPSDYMTQQNYQQPSDYTPQQNYQPYAPQMNTNDWAQQNQANASDSSAWGNNDSTDSVYGNAAKTEVSSEGTVSLDKGSYSNATHDFVESENFTNTADSGNDTEISGSGLNERDESLLKQLDGLLENGLLTKQEYEEKKRELFSRQQNR